DGLVIKAYIASDPTPTARINGGSATTVDAPHMAAFSSRGPIGIAGGEDLIKPDITAPGVQILAGASPIHNGPDVQGELFQAIAGTSMSSPHIAGVFALIKQAHPDWSAAMAKSALMTTAYQDVMKEDGVTPADPFDMGAGHVNPGSPTRNSTVFRPGLVYDAGLFEYAAFTCGADLGIFSPGSCAFLEAIGIPMDPSDLNLPSIGIGSLAGSQTIQRTVTSVGPGRSPRRYEVSVDPPPGVDVTVSPSSFVIRGGETFTYEVTFTANSGAVLNDYAFGSLTWTSHRGGPWFNDMVVYSPIAVRPTLFSAPNEVAGSGETGSASFDVNFGYTGDYTAAGHGLESAIVISDNVLQDPDQSFDPGDGFSDAHAFALSGAALLRVAIPPDATEANADLDVFVADPGGTIVASSTLGGTDELVDIVNPADGTWTVYVHGWSTPGGDSDYDMYAWVISATPGGSLSVDSAPASAVIGTSGTVDVSWTGATAGSWYLGAVSHSDAGGIIGLTLVDVDNR
ncbi:MAG: S8 family serine peptidase, partial [Anaerolineae bacterium]